jgi:hypothetical protein
MLSLKATTLDFLNSAPEPDLAPANLGRHPTNTPSAAPKSTLRIAVPSPARMDTRGDPPEYISQLRECPAAALCLPAPRPISRLLLGNKNVRHETRRVPRCVVGL